MPLKVIVQLDCDFNIFGEQIVPLKNIINTGKIALKILFPGGC
jgi:hypothetical protein